MTYNRLSEETIQDIYRLNEEGLSNRAIARELDGVDRYRVAYWLKQKGRECARYRRGPPKPYNETSSYCSKCNKIISNDKFPWVINSVDGRKLSYCMQCRYQQTRQNLNSTPAKFWAAKSNAIRSRAKRDGIEFDLPLELLINLWEKQNHKCFYTDITLVPTIGNGKRPDSPSVDRVNSSRGYLSGNVVICASRINSIKYDMTMTEMREWTPDWYRRLTNAGFAEEVL